MPERKRLTLAAALILKQVARALDDVADMFVRQVKKMHNKAEEALVQYRVAHADRTDMLIAVLREITLAYKAERPRDERLAMIETLLEKDADQDPWRLITKSSPKIPPWCSRRTATYLPC
jgi:hypothetical protein